MRKHSRWGLDKIKKAAGYTILGVLGSASLGGMGTLTAHMVAPVKSAPYVDLVKHSLGEFSDLFRDVQNTKRYSLLNYFDDEKFAGENFERNYFDAPIEFRFLENNFLGGDHAYFTADTRRFDKDLASKVSTDPSSIRLGSEESDFKVLDGYEFEECSHAFKIPLDDLPLNPVSFEVGGYEVRFTPKDLMDSLDNEGFKRGIELVRAHGSLIVNYNTMVMKSGQEPLEDLVGKIIDKDDSRESKAQKLLDFVSENIEYNEESEDEDLQVIKRPYETLLSKNALCANQAALYASLLNQVPELCDEYLLIYKTTEDEEDGHLAVGVKGDFPKEGGVHFGYKGDVYSLADPTVPGYRIGIPSESYTNNVEFPIQSLDDITHIQEPEEYSKVREIDTGEPLPFYVK